MLRVIVGVGEGAEELSGVTEGEAAGKMAKSMREPMAMTDIKIATIIIFNIPVFYQIILNFFDRILNVKKIFISVTIFLLLMSGLVFYKNLAAESSQKVLSVKTESSYWLILHRKSNLEFLYFGIPGKKDESKLIKTFRVKTGIPGARPTPLPKLLGRDYWLITAKAESKDNPETAPYFLTLDIPVSDNEPFGPKPYLECNGQCNWTRFGEFGLHGVNGDFSKLSDEDPGSSGCIRHSDEDIAFLYLTLEPEKYKIRYYIEDI